MRISDWSSDVCSSDLVSEYQFGLGIGDDVLTFERAGVRRDRDHGNTGDQCAGDGDHCLEAGGGLYCHSLCTVDSIGDRGGGGKQVGAREGCAFAETDRRSVIVEDAGVEGEQKGRSEERRGGEEGGSPG